MPSKVNIISAEQAKEIMENNPDITLIDVRQPEEYEEEHIPGAILIPLPELPDRIIEIKTDKPIITYCRLGRRSLSAARMISNEKGVEVFTIDGGIMAWDGFVAKGDIEEESKFLEDLKEPKDYISLAYFLEEGSKEFYLKVYEIFKENVFKTLASMEEVHKRKISNVFPDLIIKDIFLDRMEGGKRVSEVLEKILSGKMQFQDVIEYSMQNEINSLDLYIKIMKMLDSHEKEIFRDIVAEEKAHLRILGGLITSYLR